MRCACLGPTPSCICCSSSHMACVIFGCFFFSSRRRHTRSLCDWSSDVCSSDLSPGVLCAQPEWLGWALAFIAVLGAAACVPLQHCHQMCALSPAEQARTYFHPLSRSEERRVGKEGRSRWTTYH